MSETSFLYPPDGNFSIVAPSGFVNYWDTLEVSYTSTWSALNLTLFCLIGDTSTNYGVWQAPSNPLAASGTYRVPSIANAGFTIIKWPTPCSFKLTKYGDNDVSVGGGNFEVISQPGSSTTTYSSTASAAPSSTLASSQIASTTPVSSTSLAASASASASSSNVALSSGQAATASSSSSSSSITSTGDLTSGPHAEAVGLSTGAKAGIGIGIAAAVLAILALCFVIFRQRNKLKKSMAGDLPHSHPQQVPPSYAAAQDEKATYVNNLHELEQTNRVELPNQPVQQQRIGPTELE